MASKHGKALGLLVLLAPSTTTSPDKLTKTCTKSILIGQVLLRLKKYLGLGQYGLKVAGVRCRAVGVGAHPGAGVEVWRWRGVDGARRGVGVELLWWRGGRRPGWHRLFTSTGFRHDSGGFWLELPDRANGNRREEELGEGDGGGWAVGGLKRWGRTKSPTRAAARDGLCINKSSTAPFVTV